VNCLEFAKILNSVGWSGLRVPSRVVTWEDRTSSSIPGACLSTPSPDLICQMTSVSKRLAHQATQEKKLRRLEYGLN